MKEICITFFSVLIGSCLLNSFAQYMQWTAPLAPYPWPSAISDLKESGFGLKREDFGLPEINYTDGARSSMYMTHISDNSEERNVEFPLGANN